MCLGMGVCVPGMEGMREVSACWGRRTHSDSSWLAFVAWEGADRGPPAKCAGATLGAPGR